MENKKKHIEICIKMDENEQITPNSKISNANAAEVMGCYLAGAVTIADNNKKAKQKVLRDIAAMVSAMADEVPDKED